MAILKNIKVKVMKIQKLQCRATVYLVSIGTLKPRITKKYNGIIYPHDPDNEGNSVMVPKVVYYPNIARSGDNGLKQFSN